MFETFSSQLTFWGLMAVLLQIAIIIAVTLRVILTRHPPGSSFAWITITAVIPFVGFVLYLLVGERPIGQWRAKLYRQLTSLHQSKSELSQLLPIGPLPRALHNHESLLRLSTAVAHFPMASGSELQLLWETDQIFSAIISDIDQAQRTIDMEFYIWQSGGKVQHVMDALKRAHQRHCRIRLLLDDFGSREFLKSPECQSLINLGIEIRSAMPMRLLAFLGLQRADIRLHRKNIIIDNAVGYVGSLNMIDPMAYSDSKTVGAWEDAMLRIEGPAVESQMRVFEMDWRLQSQSSQLWVNPPMEDVYLQKGTATTVCVPSGPYTTDHDPNLYLVLEVINHAQRSLTITTPYFVPNEPIIVALQNAAFRGVKIKLILPEKSNSLLATYAARRHFDTLLSLGVEILFYKERFLHTKSIVADGDYALFGTVNMDNRSLHINFEMMLLIIDSTFVRSLQALQRRYEAKSVQLQTTKWYRRPLIERLKEGFAHLLSPLL